MASLGHQCLFHFLPFFSILLHDFLLLPSSSPMFFTKLQSDTSRVSATVSMSMFARRLLTLGMSSRSSCSRSETIWRRRASKLAANCTQPKCLSVVSSCLLSSLLSFLVVLSSPFRLRALKIPSQSLPHISNLWTLYTPLVINRLTLRIIEKPSICILLQLR